MGGKMSRNKGANFERHVANIFKALWPDARRGIGQTRVGSEVADVEGTPFWVECKRHRRCNIKAAMAQATQDTDGRPKLVVTRDDYAKIFVTMTMDEFMVLVERMGTTHGIETEE